VLAGCLHVCYLGHKPNVCYLGHKPNVCYLGHKPNVYYLGHKPNVYYLGHKPNVYYLGHKPNVYYSRKTVKSSSCSFELETPRDRTGDFEPQLVKKNQTKLSEEIDSKVISLFALGMSYRDIQKHIADMYALDISEGAITNITDNLIPELRVYFCNKRLI
jgi:hypothetical protein